MFPKTLKSFVKCFVLFSALSLVACGGSDGGGNPPPPPSPLVLTSVNPNSGTSTCTDRRPTPPRWRRSTTSQHRRRRRSISTRSREVDASASSGRQNRPILLLYFARRACYSVTMQKKSEWNKEEWEATKESLRAFSENELEKLVVELGIQFAGGVQAVKDRAHLSRKEQFILVLEEADKEALKQAIEKRGD